MITVGELIEKLQKIDQGAYVYIDGYEAGRIFEFLNILWSDQYPKMCLLLHKSDPDEE